MFMNPETKTPAKSIVWGLKYSKTCKENLIGKSWTVIQ